MHELDICIQIRQSSCYITNTDVQLVVFEEQRLCRIGIRGELSL